MYDEEGNRGLKTTGSDILSLCENNTTIQYLVPTVPIYYTVYHQFSTDNALYLYYSYIENTVCDTKYLFLLYSIKIKIQFPYNIHHRQPPTHSCSRVLYHVFYGVE